MLCFISSVSFFGTELLEFLAISLYRCFDRHCTCDYRRTRKVIQEDYEEVYTGSEFGIHIRYANVINVVFLVLLYSPGMPIVYLSLPVFFLVAFLSDKFLCSSAINFSHSVLSNAAAVQQ